MPSNAIDVDGGVIANVKMVSTTCVSMVCSGLYKR